MVQWFQERYISREEHQQIVDYYRKLVAYTYGNVRDLRALLAASAREKPEALEEDGEMTAEPRQAPEPKSEPIQSGSNVVSLGSYRDRRRSGI